METTRVTVHIEHDDEANLYSAYVPDIPGCGEGATVAEAIEDLKESLRAYIEARGMAKAISSIRPPAQIMELDLTEVVRGWLPRVSGKDMLRFLEREGFTVERVRGSHHVLSRGETDTVVPVHGNRTLAIGTLRKFLRDIDMTPDEFEERFNK